MKRMTSILLFISLFTFTVQAQNISTYTPSESVQIKKLKAKVQANPANLEAHNAFISAFRINNKMDDPALEAQYKAWMKQFPKVFTVPFAIGKAYAAGENSKATRFLLQASILKPENAEIWNLLAGDAQLRNNLKLSQEYLKKAMQFNPSNPDYAFSYAYSFKDIDSARYDSLSLEVVRRFPDSERSDQALYWLANNSKKSNQKTAYYEQFHVKKSMHHSSWYLESMTKYFDLLLEINPQRAFELGNTMVLEDKLFPELWHERLAVVNAFLKARILINEGHAQEALTLLNEVSLYNKTYNRRIYAAEYLELFKAEAADAANQTKIAYDTIAIAYSKIPTERLNTALYIYGSKLNMDSNSVAKSIQKIRDSHAKKATDFQLKNYYNSGKSSLADYAGKVVLLTYWFPGCGPCRAEFPHFESIIKKFDSKEVAYLGLNVEPSQDGFVLPFLKTSSYSFTPLRDNWKRGKGNLAAFGAPTNYLIDQKGRIVFSGFRIDAENERTLELMIRETLAAKD